MKIVIYGAGVMAQYVKESILKAGHECVGMVDPLGKGDFLDLEDENIKYDGIIDFSHFSLIHNVLEYGSRKKVPLLIATTGHTQEQIEKIKEVSREIPIIKATNTSLGVNILNEIVSYATKLLDGFDIEIIEKHHNRKIDAPSGTANTLLEVIQKSLDKEVKVVYGREGNAKREPGEIAVHAIRAGNIVGEHTVMYSSGDEIIEIKHEALSRKIFADGALKAMEFLKGKKAGYYEMRDIFCRKEEDR